MNEQRREFLKKISLAGTGIGLLNTPYVAGSNLPDEDGFSFLHLTDMHVRRKRAGDEGYATCIKSVNDNEGDAAFVLIGGDMAFDGNYTGKEEFIDQVNLYKNISDNLKMPYYNSIGNHDVLGWSSRRKVPLDEKGMGKVLIMEMLDMEKSYYSFNHKGWHFVVLDSIYPVMADHGPTYKGMFGEEQLEWLRADLGKNYGMPTVCMTHIAAFCHIGQMKGDAKYNAIGQMVVEDTVNFRQIIERHNVKAVLQGHSHVPEDYYYNDVWYITSPAVSAAWWGGNWLGYPPGYTVLNTEGESLSWEKKSFQWEAHLEPEDDLEREKIAERKAFEEHQKELLEEDKKMRVEQKVKENN